MTRLKNNKREEINSYEKIIRYYKNIINLILL